MALLGKSKDSAAATCYAALDKAIKTYRLYEGRGELTERAIEAVYTNLTTYLEGHDTLEFSLSANGFKHAGSLLDSPERGAAGYFHMFKDGLRHMRFQKGFGRDEALRLVRVLAHREESQEKPKERPTSKAPEDEEEDTITRLWEANLRHVRYEAIDAFVEGDVYVPSEKKRMSLAKLVNTKMGAYDQSVVGDWTRKGPPLKAAEPPPRFQSRTFIPIQPREKMEANEKTAIRGEFAQDDEREMERFAVIWGRLVEQSGAEGSRPLVRLIVNLLKEWMEDGNWNGLLRTLNVLKNLNTRSQFTPLVKLIIAEVAAPGALQRLKPHIENIQPDQATDALRFHRFMGKKGLQSLCRMLAEVPPGESVVAFEKAFVDGKLSPLGIYMARLRSRETGPSIDAIEKLRPAMTKEVVVDAIRKAAMREEPEVRNAALKALHGDRHKATLTGLGCALFDENPSVREYAVKQLSLAPSEVGRAAFLERVSDDEFVDLAAAERVALCTGLIHMGGNEVWSFCTEFLMRKQLFGGKKLRECQDQLADALQASGSPEALKALSAGREKR